MTTKAIVEAVIDTYSYRVRIPVINRSSDASFHTPTDELYTATVCVVNGCIPHIQVGDVVYVTFEDNDLSRPIILGYLYRDSSSDVSCDFIVDDIKVSGDAVLSPNTSIGAVTPYDIAQLRGAKANLQWQIDLLQGGIGTPSISPKERSGTFNVTDGLGSADTWTFYKNGKLVTVSGKYTGNSTSLTLNALPFKPNQDMSMIYPLMSGATLCLCVLKVAANNTSIMTAVYQSGDTAYTLTWLPIASASGTTITFTYTTDE